jgi:calcium/proton exchanger (cax)
MTSSKTLAQCRTSSKESLVYHDSYEHVADCEHFFTDPHLSYGSTNNFAFTSFGDHSSPIRKGNSPSVNNSESGKIVYRGIGSHARSSIRRLQKSERVPTHQSDVNLGHAKKKQQKSFLIALRSMITASYINLLLLAIPFAVWSHYASWPSMSIFLLNFFAMIPLAALLGAFTEEVAAHTNQTVGGLINATFGNAVEVVVAIQALLANEVRVVQASMIGSIFSNLLLVLGCCFFFGGLIYKEQEFQPVVATANMSLLALGSIALVLPSPFAAYYDINDEDALGISRIAAIFLILMYIQLLVFQLKTHADVFEDEEEEEAEMSFGAALVGLVGVTTIIAQLSGYFVESIDGFCVESGISRTFVGLIILPIVGNAVEHLTAVTVAMKNKMDLAMGVAVGSCVQIALFVAPLTVVVGWIADKPMNFNFPHFEIILFVLPIVVVFICLSDSKSNWLEGSMLMTTYVMIAVGFWFEKVQDY